jgi:hypothetical protein
MLKPFVGKACRKSSVDHGWESPNYVQLNWIWTCRKFCPEWLRPQEITTRITSKRARTLRRFYSEWLRPLEITAARQLTRITSSLSWKRQVKTQTRDLRLHGSNAWPVNHPL